MTKRIQTQQTMKQQDIRRHVSWYEKDGNEFIADENIVNMELSSLQKLFHVETDNPMYDCWEIEEQHVETLQKHFEHIINIEKYDYFVEATLVDEKNKPDRAVQYGCQESILD